MAGEQRKAFTKGHLRSNSKNPYQDPTYLTFTLMFDPKSPLFNEQVAVQSLKEQYGDEVRSEKLRSFIKTIKLINKEMPWYWKSITGIDRVMDFNMLEPYWGGADAKLEIECNESINLAISGLMDLYREAVYNFKGWTQVLPENYKRFNLYVTIAEVREIQTTRKDRTGNDVAINDAITADSKPTFVFKFTGCQFDITSAKETFSELNSSEPSQPSPKIRITYKGVEKYKAQYLQGLLSEVIDDGPGVGTETANPTFAQRAADALNDASATVLGGITNFNPINELTRPDNVYGSVFDQAFERAVNQLDDVAGGIASIPGNLFQDGLSASSREGKNIINAAKENIFGIQPGSTLGAAIRQGSINSILPQINNIGKGRQDLGNVNK